MKTLSLLTVALSALILIGCDIPSGNFTSNFAVVKKKTQTAGQKNLKEALYNIQCFSKTGTLNYNLNLILPEDFAEVNQHLYFKGTNMYAGPMEAEKR